MTTAAGASRRLRAALAGAPIDIVAQPARQRRKRLFLADMDSTMIAQECIDELADYVGLKAEVAAITERAMRGEIAFEPALRERVALLEGLPLAVVDEIIAARIALTPGGTRPRAHDAAHGAYTCLVSGGFTLFTGPIAKMVGFDEHRANRLVVDKREARRPGRGADPRARGEAPGPDRAARPSRPRREATMAVGDGANDLAMLGEAGIGVAFRAKPAVAAAADAVIEHGDLTALLYLQGYTAAELVE